MGTKSGGIGGGEWGDCGDVITGADGHALVSRMDIWEVGDTVYKRAAEIWRRAEFRAVSVDGSDIQREGCDMKCA